MFKGTELDGRHIVAVVRHRASVTRPGTAIYGALAADGTSAWVFFNESTFKAEHVSPWTPAWGAWLSELSPVTA